MSDVLLQLAANPNARRAIKQLGLPIPMPQALRRAKGPWEARPLADRNVVVGGCTPGSKVSDVLAHALTSAGANPYLVGDVEVPLPHWVQAGEAFGRPPVAIEAGSAVDGLKAHGLVFDATDFEGPEDLRRLYDFFHAWVRSVAKSGRVLVIGRPPESANSASQAAAFGALAGFAKSLAKEVGKRGATCQFVYVQQGAEDRLEAVVRWVLSDRSAFVDGQGFEVTTRVAHSGAARWTRPLEGKTALVTGGARGIGAATARTLAEAGARVTVLDLPSDDAPASKVAREIGGDVLLLDITAADAASRIGEHFGAQGRGLDVLVHNAGVTRDKTIAKMREDHWDLCVDVNLAAVARVTTTLLQREVVAEGGRIICLSSIAGIAGNMGQTNYAASKSGVIEFVRGLARDQSLNARGVTVNAIAPGFIETRLTERMPAVIREVARRFNALSQGGRPVDVAEAITFLASPGAQGLTGQVIRVCGLNMVGA